MGGFGDEPFSYSMGTIGSFPEGECGETERGADHLPHVMLRLRMSGGRLKLPLTLYDVYSYFVQASDYSAVPHNGGPG